MTAPRPHATTLPCGVTIQTPRQKRAEAMDARHTHEARHMGSAAPGWILGAVGVALLALGRTLGRPVYRGMADMGTED